MKITKFNNTDKYSADVAVVERVSLSDMAESKCSMKRIQLASCPYNRNNNNNNNNKSFKLK